MHHFLESLWTPCGFEGPLPELQLSVNRDSNFCGLAAVKVNAGRINGYDMIPVIFPEKKEAALFTKAVKKHPGSKRTLNNWVCGDWVSTLWGS